MKRQQPKRVSLSQELAALRGAVESIRLLGDAYVVENLGTDCDVAEAPVAMSAIASLVSARLELITLAVRGSVDPALMLAQHNDVSGVTDEPDSTEVILAAWTDEKVARMAREQLKRAEVRRGPAPISPRRTPAEGAVTPARSGSE